DFFRGKKILVFDDILTKGFSYARFACQLEKIGGHPSGRMQAQTPQQPTHCGYLRLEHRPEIPRVFWETHMDAAFNRYLQRV
ncbi:MAG: hypothetical protein KHY61_07065, partial [Sutterella wadsworthensis]|nr:hypothetical protein [Sutterella wadsworthensis]